MCKWANDQNEEATFMHVFLKLPSKRGIGVQVNKIR